MILSCQPLPTVTELSIFLQVWECTHACTHICMCVCLCTCTCLNACVCVCDRESERERCVCVCVCVCCLWHFDHTEVTHWFVVCLYVDISCWVWSFCSHTSSDVCVWQPEWFSWGALWVIFLSHCLCKDQNNVAAQNSCWWFTCFQCEAEFSSGQGGV